MSDLTDEQLEAFEHYGCSSGTPTPGPLRGAIVLACSEIRRRAEQAAGREHVERVVREEFRSEFDGEYDGEDLARRVADRLSVPALSEEDRATLQDLRRDISGNGYVNVTTAKEVIGTAKEVALLDRLIAAGKP